MTALLTIVHIVVCVILIAAVLLQSGKAADLAGAFGGVGSSTAFGPRGTASLLARVTTACAILFMFTSLGLWLVGSRQSGTVLRETTPGTKPAAAQTSKPAPAQQKPAEKAPQTAPAPNPAPVKK